MLVIPMYREEPIVKQFEDVVFAIMKGQNAAHEEGHSRRVAHYSAKYIKTGGGTSSEQKKAYLTGIAHDVIRPASDKPHELPSAEKFIDVVEPYQSALQLNEFDIRQMFDAIAFHGDMPKVWNINPIQDGVFFADKVFEASGAYILFRRPLFMAENKDAKGADAAEKTLIKTKQKTAKFKPDVFPFRVRKIAEYQYDLQIEFLHGLEHNAYWAVNIAEKMYAHGENKDMSLEDAIRTYEPISDIDMRIKQEAVKYLDEDLALFESL